MGVFQEIETFLQAHRACGTSTWVANQPTPEGYRLRIICPCGAVFDGRVTPEAAEDDLLSTGLLAFEN